MPKRCLSSVLRVGQTPNGRSSDSRWAVLSPGKGRELSRPSTNNDGKLSAPAAPGKAEARSGAGPGPQMVPDPTSPAPGGAGHYRDAHTPPRSRPPAPIGCGRRERRHHWTARFHSAPRPPGREGRGRERSGEEERGGKGRAGSARTWKGFTSTGSANGLVSKLDMWAVPAGRRRSAPRCRLPPFPHRFRGHQRACAERHVTSACADAA